MQILLATEIVDDFVKSPSHAESLLRRLRFAACPVVEAVHVMAPSPHSQYVMEGYTVPDSALEVEIENDARLHSDEGLQTIASRLEGVACTTRTKVLKGPVLLSLLDRADETGADLIAVNGTHTNEAMALLEGSVVRSLMVDAHCSLLIAKTVSEGVAPFDSSTGLTVVLATDHSEYANRCIEVFLRMAPRGIGAVTVLSVYPMNELRHVTMPREQHLSVPLDEAVQETLTRRNTALIAHLQESLTSDGGVAIAYHSRIVAGNVHEAIAAAMQETDADLLILGARGHGFVSRLTLGSVSYREAVASPYSVLVLRN